MCFIRAAYRNTLWLLKKMPTTSLPQALPTSNYIQIARGVEPPELLPFHNRVPASPDLAFWDGAS